MPLGHSWAGRPWRRVLDIHKSGHPQSREPLRFRYPHRHANRGWKNLNSVSKRATAWVAIRAPLKDTPPRRCRPPWNLSASVGTAASPARFLPERALMPSSRLPENRSGGAGGNPAVRAEDLPTSSDGQVGMPLREIVQRYDAGTLSTTDLLTELVEHAKRPLSEGQRGLWALHKMEPDTYSYNVPVCLSCEHVDQAALEDAFRDAVSRYPILSAAVREGDGGPSLSPGGADRFQVEYADISDVPADDVLEHLKRRAQRPFDLADEPLIRLSVLRRAESEVYVLVVVHHIILDGPSLCLVLDTFLRAYQARVGGREPSSQPGAAEFGEFVAWEDEYLGDARAERDRDFWQRALAGRIPLTGLPTEATLAPDTPHEGEVCTRWLSKEQADVISSFAASNGIIPGVFLLAVFKTLLHRYTGQEDIVIGMPVSGRPSERFDSSVGYFINTLPIRSKPVASDEFAVFAQRLQSTVFEAIDHAAYPFPRIVRDLGDRDADLRSPVFQVAYNYQNFSLVGTLQNLADELRDTWPFRVVEGLHQLGEYDLTLDVVPGDGFELIWKYHPAAFSAATIARMADHFVNLIDDVVASGGHAELGRLNLLDTAERRLLLDEWNRTDVDHPEDRTVWDLFAERAESGPDAPAVTCGEQTLTYRELADRSSALADALLRRGVGAGDNVGVCFERSLDLIVGLLAIMKRGAAYVPLDPDFPAERLSYMIRDSGAELVVCHEAVMGALSAVETHGARLYVTDRPDDGGDEVREPRAASPESTPGVAYTIYTSGSTGQPKGVVVPHRALTNFLLAMAGTFEATASDRLLAVTTYSFDIAGLELYLPLITGGHCRICDSTTAKDATLLAAEVDAWRPTLMQATPATWAMLLRVGWQNACGVKILCGGEALPENLKDQLVSRGEAWNLYGPTETTIWSTVRRLRRDEPVTIGTPIANTRLYVLDENMQPVPVGVPGELCISGRGVALGYHGKQDLTEQRFVESPFVGGERLYRTGDVARRLPNGEIVLLGRMDNQIKLRGYRIELGEIEAVLNGHPDVANSVVVVERKGRSERLAAYFTVHGDSRRAIDTKALRAHLEKTLPAYMVPSAFVALESFPLTANGKIDRARLSDSGEQAPVARSTSDAAAGAARVERSVRKIFGEVLGREDVDRDEGFFEAGGDSFSAIEVVEEINRIFGCRLRPVALFSNPSIAAMARHLAGLLPSEAASPAQAAAQSAPRQLEPIPNGLAEEPAIDGGYLDDSIAVVGMSCHFPGAENPREFWRNLQEGNGGSTFWSPEELRALGVPDELIGRPGYVPQRAVIEGKAEFDPAFFGISPRDAELMDPQGRLLLLHAWKALEDAGYRPEDVPNTSVFTSTSNNFYQALLPSLMENAAGARVLASNEGYVAWLLSQGGSVPTMISSKLGLSGPSMAVSTNCSSALSGLHLACQGLLASEVDQALVGAASLYSTMELGYVHQPGLNFSSDGRCKPFDDTADGMTGGEGVGVVVLKRARDAFADGDHVYCLIRGVAVNNDGGDKAGFYAPSVRGQVDVIRKALDKSGVDPESIRYVEAHGTGTKLGDPIEVAALTEAYRHFTDRSRYCGIGSVKSNIGHLDAAAGIAGLIKLALSLHHGEVPRSLNCDVPNTQIDWENSPFFVVDQNLPLSRTGSEPPRAGLSSFGVGGTNVHVVLEQVAPRSRAVPSAVRSSGEHLVVLSARDGERLEALARDLLAFLPEYRGAGGDLASLAYTLQTGRREMASRMAFIAADFETLAAQLGAYVEGSVPEAAFAGTVRRQDDELVSLFARTEQLQELAAEWFERGEWEKVAPLWVSGIDVAWNSYYGAQVPGRVSLPTYPFDTKPFWPTAAAEPVRQRQPVQAAVPHESVPVDADALLGAGTGGVEQFLARHQQSTAEMNGILRQLMLAQLSTIGLFREPAPYEQVGAGVIEPGFAKWLDHSVNVLVEGGELVREGDFLRTRDGAPDAEQAWRTWRAWKDGRGSDPELAAKTTLVERMIEAMPAILTGELPATSIMFPGGTLELVEAVYRRNATADYFNAMTAGAVRSEVAELLRGARSEIRLLEIGAGTGSASDRVFEQLESFERDIAEYCYTDISKAFLIEAEKRFSPRVPYLTCRTFNVELPPGEQGFAAGHYDIVIANNVLHATKDVVESVEHARALLRPGGVLLLNELAENELWSHLTFGFLDGWWRYTDGWRIDGGPALSSASWRDVLRDKGFDAVHFPAERARSLGLQTVVARVGARASLPAPRKVDRELSLETHVEEALVRSLMASLKLRREELEDDKPFADYGLDSLTGVNLVQQLNESLGTDLDPSVLFDNPSIRRLVRFVLAEHGDAITADEEPETSPLPAPVEPARVDVARTIEASRTVEAPRVTEAPRTTEAPRGSDPIAIIGMSGRFPGARNVDEFWRQLVEGRDPVTPASRWDLSSLRSRCADGGFMDGIYEFDPLFFGISGVEASYMEPQQRLFLQEVWKALEDAGHAGESLDRERCGIYVGCGAGDYFDLTTSSDYPAQAFWGNMSSLVPSRMAYYLDLHGPAMAVDTACSSSLVSMYLACQGLWAGEADLAIAGGVFVQCSPRLYIAGSRAGMLSPTGRCHTFDQAADGFVPAEGVGALVLKRLSDAEADGDHIYGVVRGIGINQDGTTNGITAPNGNSQEKLIRQIYRDFQIDPEGIQLVEAHGTGTKLGDPVEFNALVRAFRAHTSEEHFCSLGSSKANIGHAQAAAGVIGIIKTLLAMKHETMPGLLHYRTTNPGIALEGSPFYVHAEPKEWVVPQGGKRRAAITSLGASGTNAHVVIEEAPASLRRSRPGGPRLIALSARTGEALRQQVADLARACRERRDLDLGDVSYTLLLGRTHFEHRWARVVDDVVELERALTAWLSGDSAETAVGTAGRPHDLAAEYLDGRTPDFDELFRDGRYGRVPLPVYPFDRTQYELPSDVSPNGVLLSGISPSGASPSHDRQPDGTTLTGDEFYLREHRVQGTAIVPGAMYLQWAYAAARQNAGASDGDAVCLQDIVFLRPLGVAEGPRAVQVELRPEGSGTRFEVHSAAARAANAGGESVIHCQGGVSRLERSAQPVIDLSGMLRDFRRTATGPERFYAEYRELGIEYGPAFQGRGAVYEAEGAVLAELNLPDVVRDTARSFALHPALVDSAMQCMRLLVGSGDEDRDVGLVFSIKKAEIFAPCSEKMWAWVRWSDDARDAGRIDIDLADDRGKVCLALRGITGRRTARTAAPDEGAVALLPTWDQAREAEIEAWPRTAESVGIIAATQDACDVLLARYPSAHVLAVPTHGSQHDIETAIRSAPALDHLIWVAPEYAEAASGEGIVDGQSAGTLQVFRTVKALLGAGYGNRSLGWTVITNRAHQVHEAEPIDPTNAGVAGLAGSVAKEYPNWKMRVVDVDAYDTASLSAVLILPADPDGNMRIRRGSTWFRQHLTTVRPSAPTTSRLREGGTYVIVGGAGGLGTAISEHLIRQYGAQVVWLGRSPRDARIDAAIAAAAGSGGPEPLYLQADATSTESLRQARDEIERRFGSVHGVIHSGLVFSGATLAKMTEAEFHDVLRGKVDASVRLLDVFGGDSLEVALFLSSINSYLKAIKQANYAAACTFVDSFAHAVERRYGFAAKVINLGYCFNNAVAENDRAAVVGAGVPLIQASELMAAIELLCAGPVDQLTLMKFSPALNTRGITVGDDEVVLHWDEPSSSLAAVHSDHRELRDAFDDLERLRARTKELNALVI
ncbi:amino acid adenylation domain-containing protein [Saccharopolyspora sp. 5N102]|uniref:amino acid adenylation domain-containing protein n=1 Tax=Saccharopolyspora sp. 5N102 TaxID=3375155 RepID=UPI00379BE046